MKKLILIGLFSFISVFSFGQLAIQYNSLDEGIITFEQGNQHLYYFVDLTFNKTKFNQAYSEIVYHQPIYKNLSIVGSTEIGLTNQFSFDIGYLGGIGYLYKNLQVDLFYRYKIDPGIQLTLSGYQPIWKNKFAVCGYMDFWSEGGQYYTIEPQFQWNFCKRLSIGTEVRLTNYLNNYIGIFLKHNFKY